jgi:hypothetical protein
MTTAISGINWRRQVAIFDGMGGFVCDLFQSQKQFFNRRPLGDHKFGSIDYPKYA